MATKKVSQYDVIIEKDEDGVYVAHVPELPGCHTQGDSVKEVMKNISEAIELYLEYAKDRIVAPMKLVAVRKVSVPKVSSS